MTNPMTPSNAKCDCGQTPHKQLCVSNAVVVSLSPTPTDRATGRPWRFNKQTRHLSAVVLTESGDTVAILGEENSDANAALIVEAVNEREGLKAEVERLRGALERIAGGEVYNIALADDFESIARDVLPKRMDFLQSIALAALKGGGK